MKTIEIDEWDKKKIQIEANKKSMRLHKVYLKFIECKLGKDAVIECISNLAKQHVDIINNLISDIDGALRLAVYQGTIEKNMYGSEDVGVEGDEEQAVVTIGKCMTFENTNDFAEKNKSVTKNMSCFGCRAFYSALAEFLGLKNSDFVSIDEGCKYIYSKI